MYICSMAEFPELQALLVESRNELTSLNKQVKRITLLRLLSFALAVGLVWMSFTIHIVSAIPAGVLFIGFLLLVRQHEVLKFNRTRTEQRVRVIERELRASQGDFSGFEKGAMHDVRHDWAGDLDLFGEGSLYQMINRTGTIPGEQSLRHALLHGPLEGEWMLEYQASVKELIPLHRHRMEVITAATMVNAPREEYDQIVAWAGREAPALWSWVKWASPLTVIYSVTLIVCMLGGLVQASLGLLLLMIPLFVVGSQLKRTSMLYHEVGKLATFFTKLGHLMESISNQEHVAKVAQQHRSIVAGGKEAVQQLAQDLSAFDQRSNLIAALLSNMIYLAEIRNAYRALKWRREHGKHLESWLASIGEYERLVSIACFSAAFRNELCWPTPSLERGVFARALRHPALVMKEGVANDLEIGAEHQLLLITGANMAGKSTYLRTIGVSVLLAQIGAPVMADTFSLSSVKLFTSMRTSDSLESGTSYFLAELKRLSELIDRLDDENDTLALLDEILKGTNSIDKEEGSRSFVEQLARRKVLTAVATHDVSLTTLAASHSNLRNVHFASEVMNGDLHFDYTLKEGVCDTMNATWLMRSMGIIPSSTAEKNH